MARARFISPEFFTDERFSVVSIGARFLFIGIWCHSDLRGVFEYDAATLSAKIFPFDPTGPADTAAYLNELNAMTLIGNFSQRGIEYGCVWDFTRLTRISDREIQQGSTRPIPPGWTEPVGWERIREFGRLRGPATAWKILRMQVFERDDYTCTYCGAQDRPLDCDHVIPVSSGGRTEATNLTTACYACNRSKGPKMLDQWKVVAP